MAKDGNINQSRMNGRDFQDPPDPTVRSGNGRAVLNWATGKYTPEEDVPEEYRDYHMQGIGNI